MNVEEPSIRIGCMGGTTGLPIAGAEQKGGVAGKRQESHGPGPSGKGQERRKSSDWRAQRED